MKKIVVLVGIIIINVTILCCKPKKAEVVAVPEPVVSALNTKYPGAAEVTWKKETNNGKNLFDGDFKMNGKKMEARFDEDGNFVDER